MAIGPMLLDGGLASLTALNRRLIAETAAAETSVAEEVEGEAVDIFGAGGGAAPGDPDADEERGENAAEIRGRFSVVDPLAYNQVKEWIENSIFGGQPAGKSPLIAAFVNDWADELTGDLAGFPTDLAGRMIQNEDFQAGAAWLPVREQLDGLPANFRTSLENEEGVEVNYIVTNNPLTGPKFIEETAVEDIVSKYVPDLNLPRSPVTGIGSAPSVTGSTQRGGEQERERFRVVPGQPPVPITDTEEMPEGLDATERIARFGSPSQRASKIRDAVNNARSMIPTVDGADLIAALQPPAPSGGGRGGGGTRRSIVFDRAHLIAQAADRWNSRMLSPDEAPSSTIAAWVDSYIREATAFWSGKGGQLDFDTYINNKLEADPRHQQIYKHKLPGESHEQFLQKFMAPIASLGLNQEFTRSQTEAAVTSGAGPAAQFQRVSRTREAQVQNAGALSQRFARTLAEIGVG